MSSIGERMADSDPKRARTSREADKIQEGNERRLAEVSEDDDTSSE